jgi:hypothetical protein
VKDDEPADAYNWLVFHVPDLKLVKYDCDCVVIQVGPRVALLSDKDRLVEYNKLIDRDDLSHKEIEALGYLEQDWKSFDAVVPDFVNRMSQTAQIRYVVDATGQVKTMTIIRRLFGDVC